MGNYKSGKKTEILSFLEIRKKVDATPLSQEEAAYFWLLYYCGVRKSEGYERVAEDFDISKDRRRLIIDFHQRKKNGETVPPLELPRHWPGVEAIVEMMAKAMKRRPRRKAVYVYKPVFLCHKKKVRTRIIRKARWVFPHVQSTKAWTITRDVLGKGWYPHFLRMNRLSEIAQDPTANLVRLKSFSGIKSTATLNAYLGTSKKEQDKALEFMEGKIQEKGSPD